MIEEVLYVSSLSSTSRGLLFCNHFSFIVSVSSSSASSCFSSLLSCHLPTETNCTCHRHLSLHTKNKDPGFDSVGRYPVISPPSCLPPSCFAPNSKSFCPQLKVVSHTQLKVILHPTQSIYKQTRSRFRPQLKVISTN